MLNKFRFLSTCQRTTQSLYTKRFLSSETSANPNLNLLDIDDSAVKQIKFLQLRDKSPDQSLKIILSSGGCHGFKIEFDLTDKSSKDEVVIDKEGAKVLVNKKFLPLISGSKLVFTKELIGSNFRLIDNPNAASGCGCGISFELK